MCTKSVNTFLYKNSFITNDKSDALQVTLTGYPEQLLTHVGISSIWKVEARGLGVLSQPQLHTELNSSLGYMKAYLK